MPDPYDWLGAFSGYYDEPEPVFGPQPPTPFEQALVESQNYLARQRWDEHRQMPDFGQGYGGVPLDYDSPEPWYNPFNQAAKIYEPVAGTELAQNFHEQYQGLAPAAGAAIGAYRDFSDWLEADPLGAALTREMVASAGTGTGMFGPPQAQPPSQEQPEQPEQPGNPFLAAAGAALMGAAEQGPALLSQGAVVRKEMEQAGWSPWIAGPAGVVAGPFLAGAPVVQGALETALHIGGGLGIPGWSQAGKDAEVGRNLPGQSMAEKGAAAYFDDEQSRKIMADVLNFGDAAIGLMPLRAPAQISRLANNAAVRAVLAPVRSTANIPWAASRIRNEAAAAARAQAEVDDAVRAAAEMAAKIDTAIPPHLRKLALPPHPFESAAQAAQATAEARPRLPMYAESLQEGPGPWTHVDLEAPGTRSTEFPSFEQPQIGPRQQGFLPERIGGEGFGMDDPLKQPPLQVYRGRGLWEGSGGAELATRAEDPAFLAKLAEERRLESFMETPRPVRDTPPDLTGDPLLDAQSLTRWWRRREIRNAMAGRRETPEPLDVDNPETWTAKPSGRAMEDYRSTMRQISSEPIAVVDNTIVPVSEAPIPVVQQPPPRTSGAKSRQFMAPVAARIDMENLVFSGVHPSWPTTFPLEAASSSRRLRDIMPDGHVGQWEAKVKSGQATFDTGSWRYRNLAPGEKPLTHAAAQEMVGARWQALEAGRDKVPELEMLGKPVTGAIARDPGNASGIVSAAVEDQARAQNTTELMARFEKNAGFKMESAAMAGIIAGGLATADEDDNLSLIMAAGLAAGIPAGLVRAYMKANKLRRAAEAGELLARISKEIGPDVTRANVAAHVLRVAPSMSPDLAAKVGEDILKAAGRNNDGKFTAATVAAEGGTARQAARRIEVENASMGRDLNKSAAQTIQDEVKRTPKDVDFSAPGVPAHGSGEAVGEAAENLADFDSYINTHISRSIFGKMPTFDTLANEARRTEPGLRAVKLVQEAEHTTGVGADFVINGSKSRAAKFWFGAPDHVAGGDAILKLVPEDIKRNGGWLALVDEDAPFKFEDIVKSPERRREILNDPNVQKARVAWKKLFDTTNEMAPPPEGVKVYGKYAPHYVQWDAVAKEAKTKLAKYTKEGNTERVAHYKKRLALAKDKLRGGTKVSKFNYTKDEAYFARHQARDQNIQHIELDAEKVLATYSREFGRKIAWDRVLPEIKKLASQVEVGKVVKKSSPELMDMIRRRGLMTKVETSHYESFHAYLQNAMGVTPKSAADSTWLKHAAQDIAGLENKHLQEHVQQALQKIAFKVFLDWNPGFLFNRLQSFQIGPALIGERFYVPGEAAAIADIVKRHTKNRDPIIKAISEDLGFGQSDLRAFDENPFRGTGKGLGAKAYGAHQAIWDTPVFSRTEFGVHAAMGGARVRQFEAMSSYMGRLAANMRGAGKRVSVESLMAEFVKSRSRGKTSMALWDDPFFVRDARYSRESQIRNAAQATLDNMKHPGTLRKAALHEAFETIKLAAHHYGRSERSAYAIKMGHILPTQFATFGPKQFNLFWNHLTPKGKLKFMLYPIAIGGPKAIPFLGTLINENDEARAYVTEVEEGMHGPAMKTAFNMSILRALDRSIPSMVNPMSNRLSSPFPSPIIDSYNKGKATWAQGAVAVTQWLGGPLVGAAANALAPGVETLIKLRKPEDAWNQSVDGVLNLPPFFKNMQRSYHNYVTEQGGDKDFSDWLPWALSGGVADTTLDALGTKSREEELEILRGLEGQAIKDDADYSRRLMIYMKGKTDADWAQFGEDMGMSEAELAAARSAFGLPWFESEIKSATVRASGAIDNTERVERFWWGLVAGAEAGREADVAAARDMAPMILSKLRGAKDRLPVGPDGQPRDKARFDELSESIRLMQEKATEMGFDVKDDGDERHVKMLGNDKRTQKLMDLLADAPRAARMNEIGLYRWAQANAERNMQGLLNSYHEQKGGLLKILQGLEAAREAGRVSGSQTKKKLNPKTGRFE